MSPTAHNPNQLGNRNGFSTIGVVASIAALVAISIVALNASLKGLHKTIHSSRQQLAFNQVINSVRVALRNESGCGNVLGSDGLRAVGQSVNGPLIIYFPFDHSTTLVEDAKVLPGGLVTESVRLTNIEDAVSGHSKRGTLTILTGGPGTIPMKAEIELSFLADGAGRITRCAAGEVVTDFAEFAVGSICEMAAQNPNTIFGTSGNDYLFGTAGDDIFVGRAGDDVIIGGGGNDTICAGAGNDYVSSAQPGAMPLAGTLFVDAGPGDDQVQGSLGDDTLNGGDGNDLIGGGGGTDTIDLGPQQ